MGPGFLSIVFLCVIWHYAMHECMYACYCSRRCSIMHHAVYVDAYTRECTGMYVLAVTHERKHKHMSPYMCLLCVCITVVCSTTAIR